MRIVLLALLLAQSAIAQNVPRRPRLPAGADTNDAVQYFNFGRERLERYPDQAFGAFYWTYRLEPNSPQALYAMYVARLLDEPGTELVKYLTRDRRTLGQRSIRHLDSMLLNAEMQDPFLHRGMDELVLLAYARAVPRNEEWFGRSEAGGRGGIVRRTEQWFEENDPYLRGRLYYSYNELGNALQYYNIALRNLEVDWLQVERARVFAERRILDSAVGAFTSALHSPSRTSNMPLHAFEGRYIWLHHLGRAHEDRRDTAQARIAYEEALHLNPTYYPANFRLALLALQQRDTASAIFRVGLATEGDKPYWLLTAAAAVMSRMNKRDTALALLRRAVEQEPYASAGWLLYGQTLATFPNRRQDAIAAYERYLALAPRNDLSRQQAQARLDQLRQSP